ncbi:triple gene block protein 3 [Nandina mosaic virus]|nr:triple gene block protein 3 [Nandina mosaic virus]
MPFRTEAATSTEPNPSATSAPTAPHAGTHSLTPSCSSSPSPDSSYYFLAAAVLLLTALAVAAFTPKSGCTIIITGHTTTIQGQCSTPPQLVLAAHPKGLSLELYSKFNELTGHGPHRSPNH